MKRVWYLLTMTVLSGWMGAQASPTAGEFRGPPDEIGPNYKVWHAAFKDDGGRAPMSVPAVQRADAPATPETGGGVVAIGTGMHYWDGQQWSPSDASFDLTEDGFAAERIQHRVRLNAQLNYEGSVQVTTHDGVELSSTPVGIALYDPTSGRFRVIAGLTNTAGVLVASNQVVYPDAFSGGVCADIVYTVKRESFEQDVVITSRLDPMDWGFPTNSRIQVLTEFYRFATPERVRRPLYVEKEENVRKTKVSPDLIDEVLGFGEFVIGTGRALTPPTEKREKGGETVVAKEFKTVGQRTFLVESVDDDGFRAALRELPTCKEGQSGGSVRKGGGAEDGYGNIPTPSRSLQAKMQPRRLAETQLADAGHGRRSGVVVDYIAEIGPTTSVTTFRGDTTYHVLGPVFCNGPVVIEGGAVIKYDENVSITLNNAVTCKTSSFRPAIFTSVNDNSVGETVGTGPIASTGYANPALKASYLSAPAFSNLRICYAKEAIQLLGYSVAGTVSHAQLVNCVRGIVLVKTASGSGSASGMSVMIKNALFANVGTAFMYGSGSGSSIGAGAKFLSCTFDGVTTLGQLYNYSSGFSLMFTNCVLANVSSLGNGTRVGNHNGFYLCSGGPFGGTPFTPADGNPPFQTAAGGGAYYLTDGSNFRNQGTATGLPTDLVADLQNRTTKPPAEWSGSVAQDTTWPMQAGLRDADSLLDLGYHYDPLDYLVNNVSLSASLTLGEGVAMGIKGDQGFDLQAGAHLYSTGSPRTLNRICYYGNVQESPADTGNANVLRMTSTINSTLRFQFTDFALRPGTMVSQVLSLIFNSGSGELAFRDCQLRGCKLGLTPTAAGSGLAITLTNNLVEWSDLNFNRQNAVPLTVHLINNLFRSDSFALAYTDGGSNPAWQVRHNLFYGTAQTFNPSSANVSAGHNGFIAGTANGLGGTLNRTPLNADFVSGPLGDYYYPYPGQSPSLAGLLDLNAMNPVTDMSFFHYTVTAYDHPLAKKEGTSVTDIGYHYVAVDSLGEPLDTDSDGLPDYIDDDSDGDELPDSWEIQYFVGLGQFGGNDDADADGQSNRDEYLAHSDPTLPPPAVIGQPAYQMVPLGGSASFSVQGATPVSPPGSLRYQWSRDGQNLPGQTGTTLTLNNLQLSDSGLYRFTASSLIAADSVEARLVVLDSAAWNLWTAFQTTSVGKTDQFRLQYDYTAGWPNVEDAGCSWNTASVLYGRTGFTAISLCTEFEYNPADPTHPGTGQMTVTALTKRHGYMRGHSTGACGLQKTEGDYCVGKKVWFYAANNAPVRRTIRMAISRSPTTIYGGCGDAVDYTIVIFDQDLPDATTSTPIIPMKVMVPPSIMTPPHLVGVCLVASQVGRVDANIPPFDYGVDVSRPPFNDCDPLLAGNSGLPNMIPMPDGTPLGELVFIGGTSAAGTGPAAVMPEGSAGNPNLMQQDMDRLSIEMGLNPADYQLTYRSYP